VQHLYDKAKDPARSNLRQVHLIEEELIEHLQTLGFDIKRGDLGENVTTRNLNLLEFGAGARLKLGDDAVVEITGLRNPCVKIERLKKGLRQAVTTHGGGHIYMKSAVMAVVINSGTVRVGDNIQVEISGYGALPLQPV
jgi:MOSC domain-containing protein YiiM